VEKKEYRFVDPKFTNIVFNGQFASRYQTQILLPQQILFVGTLTY